MQCEQWRNPKKKKKKKKKKKGKGKEADLRRLTMLLAAVEVPAMTVLTISSHVLFSFSLCFPSLLRLCFPSFLRLCFFFLPSPFFSVSSLPCIYGQKTRGEGETYCPCLVVAQW
jgi:hypothetical protein